MVTDQSQAVLSAIDDDDVLQLAQDMVRIPSENPPCDVAEMARYVCRYLAGLGVRSWTVEPEPGRVNVMARIGDESRPGIVFNGHLDVVPAGPGWTVEPYGGLVQGGRLWGRGSADMKGGLAAILGATAALVRSGVRLKHPVLLMFTCDEETGGKMGAAHLVTNGHIAGDSCIVCEPSGLKLVSAEGGLCWMALATRGRAAHSVLAWRGVNAIEKMIQVIQALSHIQRELGEMRGAYGKRPVLTVNVVEGGVKVNQVPDFCRAQLDMRIPPGLDLSPEQIIGRIETILADLRKRDPQLQVEFSHGEIVYPFEVPATSPIIEAVRQAYHDITGRKCEDWSPSDVPPSDDSDLYHLWTRGRIPGVYFGPGEIEQAHTADEFVVIDQIHEATRIYALLAHRSAT